MSVHELARSDRGQSLIEFALASVVFLITLFGIVEFGIGIWRYNMVANLAQEGARWASVHGSKSASPASIAQVQAFVQGRAPGFSVTSTITPAAPLTLLPGATVTVRVETTYTPLTGLIPHAAMTFQSTAKMTMSR